MDRLQTEKENTSSFTISLFAFLVVPIDGSTTTFSSHDSSKEHVGTGAGSLIDSGVGSTLSIIIVDVSLGKR
jgi:hypothetical protein